MMIFNPLEHVLDQIRSELANYKGYILSGNLYLGSGTPATNPSIRLDPIYSDCPFDGPVDFEITRETGAHLIIPFKSIR